MQEQGAWGTENNNCLNGKREGEREEKRAVELFLSIPEIIDLLLSPNLSPPPLPNRRIGHCTAVRARKIYLYI